MRPDGPIFCNFNEKLFKYKCFRDFSLLGENNGSILIECDYMIFLNLFN